MRIDGWMDRGHNEDDNDNDAVGINMCYKCNVMMRLIDMVLMITMMLTMTIRNDAIGHSIIASYCCMQL
jgi:hypothetical protein